MVQCTAPPPFSEASLIASWMPKSPEDTLFAPEDAVLCAFVKLAVTEAHGAVAGAPVGAVTSELAVGVTVSEMLEICESTVIGANVPLADANGWKLRPSGSTTMPGHTVMVCEPVPVKPAAIVLRQAPYTEASYVPRAVERFLAGGLWALTPTHSKLPTMTNTA